MTHALAMSKRSYPTFVKDALGLFGIAVFIVVIIALAAGVTWLVVKVSPSPEKKKQRAALKQQA
jgi:uncharacterized membrane protein